MSHQEELRRLSKFMSLVLRHQPEKHGLVLDADGFVPLADLLAVLQREQGDVVTEARVREVVAASDKQRFEIEGEKIRARYGHSTSERITYPEVEPPEILYHGTSPAALAAIRREGLRAMRRQYVHLSIDVEQARQVGRRHHSTPVILEVRAHAAWEQGVKFFRPEVRLYLAESVPPEFIGPT